MSKSEQADIKDVGGFVGGYLKRRQTTCWSSHESFNANT